MYGDRVKHIFVVISLLCAGLAISSPAVQAGCEYDYPPFCFEGVDGSAAGFSVELMEAALEAMGQEVTWTLGQWSSVKGMLESGSVDCLPLVGRTPEREPYLDFTFPYMTLHGAVVVPADCDSILSVADLRGLTIGVMAEDNAQEFMLRSDYGVTLISTPTFQDALLLLSADSVDAVVIQRLVAMRLLSEMGLSELKVLDWPLMEFRQDFCFAVRDGNSQMLALLNEGLAIVMADGTYSHLHSKWFAHLQLPSSRSLVVVGDSNFPPFEFIDSLGEPAGLNVDLIRQTAAEVGLDVEVRLGSWTSVMSQLETGEADILSGMFYSPNRDTLFDFTQPHTIVNYVPVVASGVPPSSLDELNGLTVAVQEGDIAQEYLIENGFTGEIVVCTSQEEALSALIDGESDCALVARLSAEYFRENGHPSLIPGEVSLLSPGYCFAVKSGNQALLAELSEGLRVVVNTGGYRRTFEKWMGNYVEEETVSFAGVLRRSLVVIVPLIAVLLLVFLWVRLLRRQVLMQTQVMRRRESILNSTQRLTSIGGWEYNIAEGLIHWTRETYRIHGLTPGSNPQEAEESISSSIYCYLPEYRSLVESAFRKCVENGEPYELECRFKPLDSGEIWIRTGAKAVYENGSIVRISGFIRDITSEKENELSIAHLNRVLRAVRDISQLMVRETDTEALLKKAADILVEHRSYRAALLVSVDTDGVPVLWKHAGQIAPVAVMDEMFGNGITPRCFSTLSGVCEVIDRESTCNECPLWDGELDTVAICVHLDYGGVRYGFIEVTLDSGVEMDGEERELLAEMAGDMAYALAAIRTNEERIKAEADNVDLQKQLLQSQKMEAVGQLAGGIAHDFNNMLHVILGHARVLEQICHEDRAASSARGVIEGASRAAELTKQLLLFSRRQVMSLQVIDFNELVENLLRMIRRIIGEQIKLEWLPGDTAGSIHADRSMIEQVIMNLCVNARDAMPSGGRLTIKTMNVLVDSSFCATHSWASPGRFVLLSVSDNGEGMDRGTMDRIFEPFFTTKGPGKGTGIGLATVYGIVKQHDGMINTYSEPGKGSLFKIYLPVSDLAVEEERVCRDGPAYGGSETILIAEDDEMVRSLAKEMLENAGYKVLIARDGNEAVSVFRAADAVDMLLLDVIMPGLGGHEAMAEIRKLNPDVPVLFSSGYSENAIHTNFVLNDGLMLIQKPYSSNQLLKAVRRVLNR